MADNHETYQQYEGLAVSSATRLWGQWASSLSRRGVDREDLLQAARLALTELAPRLTDPAYGEEQRRAFVTKSIRGKLLNLIKAALRDGDHRDRADPPEVDTDGLLDLDVALQSLDEQTRKMVLSRYGGRTYKSIGAEHGLTAAQAAMRIKAGLAALKKILHA